MRFHSLITLPGAAAGIALALSAQANGQIGARETTPVTNQAAAAPAFTPPPESAIPAGAFGDAVREGEAVFNDTGKTAAEFTGNALHCSNCHLDSGRQSGAAPLWAAYVNFPAFRAKNDHVNSFEERLGECFRYSMNGKMPPPGNHVLVALETYAFFLAKGLPVGESPPGRGFPALAAPPAAPDYMRGHQVYARNCETCHGADGAGHSSGEDEAPPLWGPQSFNWGAGMGSVKNAAEFIHANMPYGKGGTLSPQQAWDVAAFVDSQARPQDPRFTGDVAQTRAKFHNTPYSLYGKMVNGVVLGAPRTTPPSGTVQQ